MNKIKVGDADRPHLEAEQKLPKEQLEHTSSWWKVMCLTGVDYFSTLGYQPGLAILAAGVISPAATLVLVLVTLLGALPAYALVAKESPHGQGSIAMLARQFSGWRGKVIVLILLGFVVTAFLFTITLSAADATAHLIENPLINLGTGRGIRILSTIVMIVALTAVFLGGLKEAVRYAVLIVALYLTLTAITIGACVVDIAKDLSVVERWSLEVKSLFSSPFVLIGTAMLVFPKLALGLSGFETGVAVMPLVKGDRTDSPGTLEGRIKNTRKLLMAAASVMSTFLILSAFVTTLLIPANLLAEGQPASGRALAYLAHQKLGTIFGTAYDLATIFILWFAGASAFTGLLTIIPQYLPRYGMAPNWTAARVPLSILICALSIIITVLFDATITGQAGPYTTGILVMITSAAIAAYLSLPRESRWMRVYFFFVSAIFVYTTFANMIQQISGVLISLTVVALIIVCSFIYRFIRSTELRINKVIFDGAALKFIRDSTRQHWGQVRLLAHKPNDFDYKIKEEDARKAHSIQKREGNFIFLEIERDDASEFVDEILEVQGVESNGNRILRCRSHSVANALAAVLLEIRDQTETVPHVYLRWTEGHPLAYALKFVFFGEGETASLTREILRSSEADSDIRPIVHVA